MNTIISSERRNHTEQRRNQAMENLEVTLRKHQHTLAVVGMGVIAFGIWSVVKSILYLVFINPIRDQLFMNYENVSDFKYERMIVFAVTVGTIILVDLLDLSFRWKIGRRALAISRGERELSVGFYVRSAFVTLVDAIEFILGFLAVVGGIPSEEDLPDRISTLLVDITSVVMMIEMIIAAVMIGKITKRLKTDNAD